jgi:hypothetical protein
LEDGEEGDKMGKVNGSAVIVLEMPTDEEEGEGRRRKVGWRDGGEVEVEMAQPELSGPLDMLTEPQRYQNTRPKYMYEGR